MVSFYEDGIITIKIPITEIVDKQLYRQDFQYIITDEIAMGEYLSENIIDSEDFEGDNLFEGLIDYICDNAYEIGESWIEPK